MKIAIMLRAIAEDQGTGIYTRQILPRLVRSGRDDEFLLLYRNELYDSGLANLSNVTTQILRAPSKFAWDQVAVANACAHAHVDLLFSPKFVVPLFAPCKTVVSLHGSEWFVSPERYPSLDLAYVRLMTPFYCRRADALISNSGLTTNDFIKILHVPPQKIVTVPFGVSPNFRPITDSRSLEATRTRYGLPPRFLLFVGKIYPGKNFGNLVAAFAQARDRIQPPLKLVVVGDMRWDYEEELASIDRLGIRDDVLFTGWVPQAELPAFYSLADSFILPAFYEGFGLPVVEALACGCPAIVSRTGALPEVAGDAAVFVDPQDPAGIADAIVRVASDEALRAELRTRGFERAKRFDWDEVARQTLTVLRQVVRGERLSHPQGDPAAASFAT